MYLGECPKIKDGRHFHGNEAREFFFYTIGSKTAKQLYNSYQICSDHFEDSQYMDPAHTSLMPHAISIDFI